MPGGLKNAIDWVSKLKDVPFKESSQVALQSASAGQMGGGRMQYHLRMILTSIDAQMFGKPEIFINFAAKKIDETSGVLRSTSRPRTSSSSSSRPLRSSSSA